MDDYIIKEVIEEMKKLNAEYKEIITSDRYNHRETEKTKRIRDYYNNLPTVLKNNKEITLAALSLKYIYVSYDDIEKLPKEKDVAKIAISADWENAGIFEELIDRNFAMELAKDGIWSGPHEDYSVVEILRKKDPQVFKDDDYMREILKYPDTEAYFMEATDEIRNDKEVVLHMLNNSSYIPSYVSKGIGDNLKLDPEVQSAFAKAMRKSDEEIEFIMDTWSGYVFMSDIDKKFSKKILLANGFIDNVITGPRCDNEVKEAISDLLTKMSSFEDEDESNYGKGI